MGTVIKGSMIQWLIVAAAKTIFVKRVLLAAATEYKISFK